ncbi:MAG: nucleotidyltransferase domain-containing protein [Victivallales bacterium]|nr:nucleotidyltransferase domain-containing protein [Victivallales bacterium]
MKMCQLDRLQQLKGEIQRIAVKNNAGKIYVFGSCARKEETSDSDIDFIADFKEHATLFDHAGLELELSDLLGCAVDVVSLRRLLKDDEFSKTVRKEMLELC